MADYSSVGEDSSSTLVDLPDQPPPGNDPFKATPTQDNTGQDSPGVQSTEGDTGHASSSPEVPSTPGDPGHDSPELHSTPENTGHTTTQETLDQSSDEEDTYAFSLPFRLRITKPRERKNSTQLSPLERSRRRSRAFLQSPDRFIPIRRPPTAPLKSFHTNKPLYKLNQTEKLLRQRSASPDPFGPLTQNQTRPAQRAMGHRLTNQRAFGLGRSTMSPTNLFNNSAAMAREQREPSVGSIWNIGGRAAAMEGPVFGINNGRGRMISSGSNAPMYSSNFLPGVSTEQEMEAHEERLAAALDMDRAGRILDFSPTPSMMTPTGSNSSGSPGWPGSSFHTGTSTIWQYGQWVPQSPYLLDAPQLRNDFYCSLIAYSEKAKVLAVGLGNCVFLWSEQDPVHPMNPQHGSSAYLTSLSFSSGDGGRAILAMGRADGYLALWNLYEPAPRVEILHSSPIATVAWRPKVSHRRSARDLEDDSFVNVEDLLVGNEAGEIYYYAIEWTSNRDELNGTWMGSVVLLCRIKVHAQQICGLAWSPDGTHFATGGNDNACCLYSANALVNAHHHPYVDHDATAMQANVLRYVSFPTIRVFPLARQQLPYGPARPLHRWMHGAAVKAMAFCPWQPALLATGGGSNDRAIHFWHTTSGACLATIDVSAQVTSLVWSSTRREIAATFGYPQPEHPVRIAVFSWPECRQLVAIPWDGDNRALYAIAYPGGPNDRNTAMSRGEGGVMSPATAEEGCIVVASSDECIKFHEVWGMGRRNVIGGGNGQLGGSAILESLQGIMQPGADVIR
ncbi:MAG: hypothetical protein M1823_004300 [Watsoniomyces obsoletus]|nr:MAG: hypothetical protein M1823_004300 [Watsoniomyces obsoletus]